MATQAAVANRRANRKAWRESQARRRQARNLQLVGVSVTGNTSQAWAERQRKDRESAVRLCAKHFVDPSDHTKLNIPTPIVLLYDYWMARACGWDVLRAEYARDRDERPCEPAESYTWFWWESLHWRQRVNIRGHIKEHFFAQRKAS